MSSKNDDHYGKNWLQRMQEGSWEPEILISGIVLYGLFKVLPIINNFSNTLELYGGAIFSSGSVNENVEALLQVAITWLIIGFISHLIFRSVWVAFLGLSYVYKDNIDLDVLRYGKKFKKHLGNKIDLKKQIEKLERVCSSIFAFSFLFFMNILGLVFLFLIISAFISLWLHFFPEKNDFSTFNWIFIFSLIVIFIDFITLGLLKRIPYFNKIYYPFYRFFSLLLLAPLYRNIYYSLASNHKKWKVIVSFALFTSITFLIAISVVSRSLTYSLDLRPDENYSHSMDSSHYLEECEGDISKYFWIPSIHVNNNTLDVFVVHRSQYEERYIKPACNYDDHINNENINKDSLKFNCVRDFYLLKVNDRPIEYKMRYMVSKKTNQDGLITFVNISNIPSGLHTLSLYYRFNKSKNDTDNFKKVAELSFYKEELFKIK